MKKLVLLTLALVLAASTAAVAGVHEVGGPGTEGNTIPFWAKFSSFPQMRWQTMWRQNELKEAGGVSKVEFRMHTGFTGQGGVFNGCKILLCNTNVKEITSNFAANYGKGTPVTVFEGTYNLPSYPAGAWAKIVEPKNFTYNNTDNLLIEVSWTSAPSGGTNHLSATRGGGPGRVFAAYAIATIGTFETGYWQVARITIGFPGVNPTSLGRVKSLFR